MDYQYRVSSVWTTGFMLLLQSIVGLLAASLILAVWDSHAIEAASLLDAALSILLLYGVLRRRGLGGPSLWPSLPGVLPVVAIYYYYGAHTLAWEYVMVAAALSRLYFAATALSMISRYWRGVSLGSDSTLIQLAVLASLVILSGAVLVYVVESRDPASPIKTFGDALWWALATATTVGYGDVVPVTLAGRIIASLLMIFGIGSLGVFISDMAARIVKLALLGIEGGSTLDREKAIILRKLSRLEDLSDAELELVISKLRLIHAITRGSDDPALVQILDDDAAAEALA
ncbi:MAG: ion channel [Desulfurococcales archaeon]|nr:ion channel [Desulfurococcales archaeon]